MRKSTSECTPSSWRRVDGVRSAPRHLIYALPRAWDLALDLEEPFTQHVKPEDARRQGDADDIMRYACRDERHEAFGYE